MWYDSRPPIGTCCDVSCSSLFSPPASPCFLFLLTAWEVCPSAPRLSSSSPPHNPCEEKLSEQSRGARERGRQRASDDLTNLIDRCYGIKERGEVKDSIEEQMERESLSSHDESEVLGDVLPA